MIFFCYSRCSTCKKAQKWLDDHGLDYELRDIKENNPSLEELKSFYEKSGKQLKKLFNTSGLIYRELNLKDRLPDMTEEEMLSLLSSDGMLVKRPLLVSDDNVLTGFKEKEWEELLL